MGYEVTSDSNVGWGGLNAEPDPKENGCIWSKVVVSANDFVVGCGIYSEFGSVRGCVCSFCSNRSENEGIPEVR